MVCFQTKNPNEMKRVGILPIWLFGINYSHLVYLWPFDNLVAIWYIFPCFGILNKVKSGNPGEDTWNRKNNLSGPLRHTTQPMND
jgi:hypothetical protein